MDALTALHTRNSINLLTDPAPSADQLENIFKAGLRACDHKSLTPWKYIVIQGDARIKFGDLLVEVKAEVEGRQIDSALADKLRAKPMRAPTIIVVATNIKPHDKVPEIEQVMSAAASAQMMMVAAHAQGVGAIWRSGSLMFDPKMRLGLGLKECDQIVGFLYLGKPLAAKPLPYLDTVNFVDNWPG